VINADLAIKWRNQFSPKQNKSYWNVARHHPNVEQDCSHLGSAFSREMAKSISEQSSLQEVLAQPGKARITKLSPDENFPSLSCIAALARLFTRFLSTALPTVLPTTKPKRGLLESELLFR